MCLRIIHTRMNESSGEVCMIELKKISAGFVPEALRKAEKYRLLNHPKTAESICRDILTVEEDNQEAISLLIVSITEQFGNTTRYADIRFRHAEEWVPKIHDDYHRYYLSGLIRERWAKSRIRDLPGPDLYEYFHEAMEFYEKAEPLKPEGDESTTIHWNLCARQINRHPHIRPPEEDEGSILAGSYGDSFPHHPHS